MVLTSKYLTIKCSKHFSTETSLFVLDILAHLSSPLGLLAGGRFTEHNPKP